MPLHGRIRDFARVRAEGATVEQAVSGMGKAGGDVIDAG